MVVLGLKNTLSGFLRTRAQTAFYTNIFLQQMTTEDNQNDVCDQDETGKVNTVLLSNYIYY